MPQLEEWLALIHTEQLGPVTLIKLLNSFKTHFNKYLTPSQFQTLSILIGLLNQYKQIKIERLATYFPLPILEDKS